MCRFSELNVMMMTKSVTSRALVIAFCFIFFFTQELINSHESLIVFIFIKMTKNICLIAVNF